MSRSHVERSGTLAGSGAPRGLLRLALRLPLWLYRARLGWLLGHRFLLLAHRGRSSGRPHQAVLEVVRRDKRSGVYVVASGWGESADWFRNIQKTPEVRVQVGNRRFEATAVHLPAEVAERELLSYARRHPLAFRALSGLMTGQRMNGTEASCHEMAQSIPLVALVPKSILV